MTIEMDLGSLRRGLSTFDEARLIPLVTAVVERQATIAEGWMKSNARWQDRTGNARCGLRAKPSYGGRNWYIYLMGGVPYQIWLEVRWGGKYAIITPALQVQGQALMRNIDGLLDRLR